jgi:hypothetical protein
MAQQDIDTLNSIKQAISALSDKEIQKIDDYVKAIKLIIDGGGQDAQLALALVGAELAAK